MFLDFLVSVLTINEKFVLILKVFSANNFSLRFVKKKLKKIKNLNAYK